MNSKQELRKYIKEKRKTLDINYISKQLVEKLINSDIFIQAKHVMLFYPLDYEVNLLKIIEDSSKNFYLPKIHENNLLCCPYQKDCHLNITKFKTKEPTTTPIDKSIIDLVIVPALAVDKNNYRLGYGGGFYDRFLKDITCTKITCIPKTLIEETVFPEEHDIKIDLVITA